MARYCPQCGTPTVKREDGGRERDVCPACGWVQYAEVAVGVGALILRGERVLLVERAIPPVGRWTLPSGWIEQEDTLASAVVREVREETGLACAPLGIICVRNIPRPGCNDVYVCLLCAEDRRAEPVADGAETRQARFVAPAEFDRIDLSPFSRYVIEQYVRERPQPWPLLDDQRLREAYPGAAIFAPFAGQPGSGREQAPGG